MTHNEFHVATLFQDVRMFKDCLLAGVDHSAVDYFGRTPIFGLRFCHDASVGEFREVLHLFMEAGADIEHVDDFGNTLLLLCKLDALGVALVEAGARLCYEYGDLSKRALSNAAAYGCTRTVEAMVQSRLDLPDQITRSEFDSAFDRAAKMMAPNSHMEDTTGLVKLVVDYGASINKWNTLHNCCLNNRALVSTLLSLGADAVSLSWDFSRGVKSTPLHRTSEVVSEGVFDELAEATGDVNIRDGTGATPLMVLMEVSPVVRTDDYLLTRFKWLMNRGASCLPFDNQGRRVSSLVRSKRSPFKELIAARLRDENWEKRRGMILLRETLAGETVRPRRMWWKKRLRMRRRSGSASVPPPLEERFAGSSPDGVFRHIVTFL